MSEYLGGLSLVLVSLFWVVLTAALLAMAVFYGVGLVLAVLSVIYLSIWARQVLAAYESEALTKSGGDVLA